eukprot:scaffold492_cov341-Pavlova_lutheri.AAC.9
MAHLGKKGKNADDLQMGSGGGGARGVLISFEVNCALSTPRAWLRSFAMRFCGRLLGGSIGRYNEWWCPGSPTQQHSLPRFGCGGWIGVGWSGSPPPGRGTPLGMGCMQASVLGRIQRRKWHALDLDRSASAVEDGDVPHPLHDPRELCCVDGGSTFWDGMTWFTNRNKHPYCRMLH